MGWTVYVVVT